MKSIRISLLSTLCLAASFSLLLAVGSGSAARAQTELLTNGDFETGAFSGWTLANQHNPADTDFVDHFTVSTPGADTPAVDGFSFPAALNPAGGNFYAVSVSDNPGAHALLQNFTVPTGATATSLSFQLFVNDQSGLGAAADPSGLDYTSGGTFNDNQYARVDLLSSGASDLSTASGDVLYNFYLGVDPGTLPNSYQSYAFNLNGLVTPGETYRLRFAEVDNLGALNVGVDNVQVISMAAVTPELGAPYALLSGLLCWGASSVCRRFGKRNKRAYILKTGNKESGNFVSNLSDIRDGIVGGGNEHVRNTRGGFASSGRPPSVRRF